MNFGQLAEKLRSMLARLIMWAIADRLTDLFGDAFRISTTTELKEVKAGISEHAAQLYTQEQAWMECAAEIEKLRARVAELSETAQQTSSVRRAPNFAAFRTAAEQSLRSKS